MSRLKIDRQTTVPFHLKLFYGLDEFHPLTDFAAPDNSEEPPSAPSYSSHHHGPPPPASGVNSIQPTRMRRSLASPPPPASSSLPAHLQIYTWQTCTLRELSQLLASALPWMLPDPPVGTRLSFRLIYPDTRGAAMQGPGAKGHYLSKDIGSVVIGSSRDGGDENVDGIRVQGKDADRMLSDVRFVVGDYVDCAILPPLDDGSIAPPIMPASRPSSFPARNGGGPPSGPGMRAFRENGFGDGGGRSIRGGSRRGGFRGGFGFSDRGFGGMPSGEWKRGETLPDDEGGHGGRRGGRGSRGRGRGGGGWGSREDDGWRSGGGGDGWDSKGADRWDSNNAGW